MTREEFNTQFWNKIPRQVNQTFGPVMTAVLEALLDEQWFQRQALEKLLSEAFLEHLDLDSALEAALDAAHAQPRDLESFEQRRAKAQRCLGMPYGSGDEGKG